MADTQPKGDLVPVTDANKGDIKQVNDVGNRVSRSFVNMSPFSFAVLVLEYFGVSIPSLFIAGAFQFGVPAISGARRWLEIRKDVVPGWLKWIVFSPPPAAVTTAPPTNAQGQILGEVKV